MKKMMKFLVLVCMLFSQFASPVKIIAEEIAKANPIIDEVLVTGDSENEKISFKVDGSNFHTKVDNEDLSPYHYIVKMNLKFKPVKGEIKEQSFYDLKFGYQINGGEVTHEFDNFGYGYNGTYTYSVEIYDVNGIDPSITDYEQYVINNSLTSVASWSEDFVEESIPKELKLVVNGDVEPVMNDEDPEKVDYYNVIDNGNINFDIQYGIGDLSSELLEGSYLKIFINDIELYPYNFKYNVNFKEMLKGDYTFKVYLYDKNGNVLLETNELIKNNVGIEDKTLYYQNEHFDFYNRVISSTLLSESELLTLYPTHSYEKDFIDKKPIDEQTSWDLGYTANSFHKYNDTDENYTSIISKLEGIVNAENGNKITVSDIVSKIKNDEYFKDFNIFVTDKNGNTLNNDVVIGTSMQLNLIYGDAKITYNFVVSGDIDDGYVTDYEVRSAINHSISLSYLSSINMYALDVNDDNKVDLLDVTLLAGSIHEGRWLSEGNEINDLNSNLVLSSKNNSVIRKGDTFYVDYLIKGYENGQYINGIEGILDYDKDVFELVGVTANNEFGNYGNMNFASGKFMYATGETYSEESVLLTFAFKAKQEGKFELSVKEDRAASDGTAVTLKNDTEIMVKIDRPLSSNNDIVNVKPSTGSFDKPWNKDVLEYTLYVDSWVNSITLEGLLGDKYAKTFGFREYLLTGDVTVITLSVVAENGEIKTYKITVKKVYPKSSNNYLSNLEIEGYDIDFNKNNLEYKIKVDSSVNSLNITASAEDANARVVIYGNDNFKEGENTVTIVVTAEDGSERTYKILVDKESKKSVEETNKSEDEENNQLEKTVVIILIILVIVGLLYLIFKKDDADIMIIKSSDESNNKKNDNKK